MPADLSLSQVAPDPVLSNIAIQSSTGGPFIADRLLPVRNVVNDLGRYTVWGRENITPDVPIKRAFGVPARQTSISRSYTPFSITADRSLTIPLPDEIVENSPNPASIEAQRTRTIMDRLRLDIEKDVKTMIDAITNTTTVAIKWNGTNPVIEANLDAAKELFVLQFGLEPNSMLIPAPIARIVKRDPTIRDQIKYTHQDILINGDLPPVLFNLNVIIPGAIQKSAPSQPITRIWNSHDVTLLYIDPNTPDEDTNTFGLQIRSAVGVGLQTAAYRWRDPNPTAKTSYVAAAIKQIELIVNMGLALTIKDVI